jgi:hypothetical protein
MVRSTGLRVRQGIADVAGSKMPLNSTAESGEDAVVVVVVAVVISCEYLRVCDGVFRKQLQQSVP